MGTIISIGNAIGVQKGSKLTPYQEYFKRVLADGGEVPDNVVTKQILKHLQDNKTYDSTKLLFCPEAGIKLRKSGVNFYVPKIYDLAAGDGVNQDGTQTTESNQPYLSGNIAPNEKLSLKGNSFVSRLLTHQDISFADSLPFSFTFITNLIGSDSFTSYDYYNFGGITFGHRNDGLFFFIYNGNGGLNYYTGNIYKRIKKGKTNIYTIVVENRRLELYVNNLHIGYLTREDSSIVFNMLRISQTEITARCSIFYHRIQSGAMTSEQVSTEHTFLRSLYPEIPSVQIGTQTWATSNLEMVATPQENVINNVTINSNTEKITNAADRDFSSDTGWWTKSSGITIGSNVASFNTTSNGSLNRQNFLTPNKWYKITLDLVSYTRGDPFILVGGNQANITTTLGSKIFYIQCRDQTYFGVYSGTFYSGGECQIDNVSVQEIGWGNSQELYDAIYAATAGTDEQKTYAAVKAAAMWCYYNNDPSLGAIYGKLYNWFAVKLLQMDIDYYNVANPSTPWGWHVPTLAEFTTLQTSLGGGSVAGGKMKVAGTDYWDSPNTGADNSSGFSLLPAGRRHPSLNYQSIKLYGMIAGLDKFGVLCRSTANYNNSISEVLTIGNERSFGYALRLIKD